MQTQPLYIKRTIDGVEGYFPNASNPAIIGTFTNDRKRMGGAPTLTATLYYPQPLDDLWTHEEYVEYDGERYYATSIPSSSKDNTTLMYKHELTFSAKRETLDNTLFFDVVSDNSETQQNDIYRSNLPNFTFGGNITEFVSRINSSLAYCGLYRPNNEDHGYYVTIDEGYATDEVKEISFDNQYITEVLQLINTEYELDYYWVGKVCHVGKVQHDLSTSGNYGDKYIVRYGQKDALLSVSKENSNAKIIDMITGSGSSDNIPYYYPNDDEFGSAIFDVENFDKALVQSIDLAKVFKWNGNSYNNWLTLGKIGQVSYKSGIIGNVPFYAFNYAEGKFIKNLEFETNLGYFKFEDRNSTFMRYHFNCYIIIDVQGLKVEGALDFSKFAFTAKEKETNLGCKFEYDYNFYVGENMTKDDVKKYYTNMSLDNVAQRPGYNRFGSIPAGMKDFSDSSDRKCIFETDKRYAIVIRCGIGVTNYESAFKNNGEFINVPITAEPNRDFFYIVTPSNQYMWSGSDGTKCAYDEAGIIITNIDNIPAATDEYVFDAENGNWNRKNTTSDNPARLVITGRDWITPISNLMPSVYRQSKGKERFYLAKNDTYKKPGTDKYYEFKNPYKENDPHQGSVSYDDIKPTINGIRNDIIQSDGLGQLFGEIADVAFDSLDSDVMDSNNNYIHQYFYIKLHKFSGEFGFDLFSHALAKENAVINMIDCQGCPACAFPIKTQPNADNSKMFNCVSTDGNGNLVSLNTDKDDYILSKDAALNDKLNQNSKEKEIWIAVKKDNSTLGIVMPNAAGGFKPKKGDKFVITGINPPKELTLAAEKRLDEALIKYMSENNDDQFTYSVKFSRIFLAEHPDFTERLNENAKLSVEYNGHIHDVFVSNYTVKVDESILSEVEVELVNSLEISQSELKQMIDSVKGETVRSLANLSGGGGLDINTTSKAFLSKINQDTARGLITFLKGLAVGDRYGVTQDGDATLRSLILGAYGIESDGDARLNDVEMSTVTLDRAHSTGSTEADRTVIGGQGFDLYMGEDGKSRLYVDYLTARVKAFFAELEVRKVSYSGGTVIYSNAGSTIAKVDAILGSDGSKVVAYKCYCVADDGTTRTQNWWKPGMMALSQTFNVKAGTTEDAGNRRYWRLCVGAGQQTLEDGRLYDWVMLSNVSEFKGNEEVIPTVSEQVVGYGDTAVVMGNVAVSVASQEMATFASVCGLVSDDDGAMVLTRTFYGVEDGSDAPLPGDVVVQAGDQIKWNTRGNAVVVRTSSEDGADGSAPSFAMYHGMGKMRDGGVWQWKERTKLDSPELTEVVASRFRFVTDDGESYTLAEMKLEQDRFSVSVETLTHKDEELQKGIDAAKEAANDAGQSAEDAQRDATTALNDVAKVEKRTSTLEQTASEISGKVTSLTGSYDELSGKVDGVTEQVGELSVRADKISMKVSQAEVRDRNLLPGSYAQIGGKLWGAMSRTVRLLKGQSYAMSVWGMIDTVKKGKGGSVRVSVWKENASGAWTWEQNLYLDATEETRKVVTFGDVPSDGDYKFGLFTYPESDSDGYAFVRKVQIEEVPSVDSDGTAWTPYVSDPVAQGNIVGELGTDGGGTVAAACDVTKGGVRLDGHSLNVAHGKAATSFVNFVVLRNLTLTAGESYTLSFWARGTGSFSTLWVASGGACMYAVQDNGSVTTGATGSVGSVSLTEEWKRHSVTVTLRNGNLSALIPFRLLAGGEAWLSGVKLEPCGRVTDYTEESITEDELKATGIDIYNRKIVVTADQFRIQNNKGEETFSVDGDGMVTMNNIAIGGVINRQGVDVTSDAVAQTLFDVYYDSGINTDWYDVPKLDMLYPIYYIKGTPDSLSVPFELHMPSAYVDGDGTVYGDVWDADGKLDADRLRKIRGMVGNVVTIYNEGNKDISVKVTAMADYFTDIWLNSNGTTTQAAKSAAVSGTVAVADTVSKGDTVSDAWESGGLTYPVLPGDTKPMRCWLGRKREEMVYTVDMGGFISLRCVCEVGSKGRECVYWIANYGYAFNT